MPWSVMFTIAIAGSLQSFVNGRTACFSIEDSLRSSVSLATLSHINPSVASNNAGNLLLLFLSTKFKCHGSIQSWSGIIHVDTDSGNLSNYSTPLMHLQVWRPHKGRSYFSLVGSSPLMQHSVDINSVYLHRNDTITSGKFYHDFNVRLRGNATGSEENSVIYFQPEDVLGCYIPAGGTSPGFGFGNFTGEDKAEMDLLIFSTTTRLMKCEVSVCDASVVTIKSVLPQIIPQYAVNEKDEGSGKVDSICSHESVTVHKEATLCNDCSSDEPSSGKVIPGLLAVVVAVCLATVCLVGITSNTLIIWYARFKMKKRHLQEEKRNSDSSLCNFIVKAENQTEFPNNIRSLADFLQYNIQNESTTESFNVTWV